MIELTDADRAELARMQPVIEVLSGLVICIGALNPHWVTVHHAPSSAAPRR